MVSNDEQPDYTHWDWFDYRLHFDAKTEPRGEDAYHNALRYEALGIPFNIARFVGFPPAQLSFNGERSNKVSPRLLRTCVNFDLTNTKLTLPKAEALIAEGMDWQDAISWAELGHKITLEETRELIIAGDIDPVGLRELMWDEMWDLDFALNVYRNDLDMEMARNLYEEPEMKQYQIVISH